MHHVEISDRAAEITGSYPGYQRLFSRAVGIFVVGLRPKPRTALEKSLAPRVTGSGPVCLFMHNFRREENLYNEIIQA